MPGRHVVVLETLEDRVLSEVCPAQMASTHYHLLKLIALEGSHLLAEMANFLGVSQPAVSKAIDRLEKLGMVKRSSATHDRRVMVLKATPKGAFGALASAKVPNEDNYVMQKFTRAVMETNNIDHCARL